VEITKEISDGDRSPTQARCHTGPATTRPTPRLPQPLRWRHAACRFTAVHTFACGGGCCVGPAVPRPRGPVCGHDPRPPRPGKRSIRSISYSRSRCSPSLAASACPSPVASGGYKTFPCAPSREALLNFSFSTGDYSGHSPSLRAPREPGSRIGGGRLKERVLNFR